MERRGILILRCARRWMLLRRSVGRILRRNEQENEFVEGALGNYRKEERIMNNWATDKSVWLLVAAILFNSSTIVFAGDASPAADGKDHAKEVVPLEKSWCQTPPPFEVRVALPGWLAGLSGETGVKGIDAFTDVKFSQLLSHLTHVPIVLAIEARYQRWEFFGDGQYIVVGDSATLPGLLFTTANVHIKSGLAEGFLGYRLINCDKASLSLFAGARYNYMAANISILDNGDARLPILRQLLGLSNKLDVNGSTDWVDPVLGARGKVKLWKAVSLWAEGDVGGFDANGDSAFEVHRDGGSIDRRPVASEDWSYQVHGGLEIQLTRRMWSQIGWRYLQNNYRSEGFINETELSGPFLNTGFSF